MADGSLDIDTLSDFEIVNKLRDFGWYMSPEKKATRKTLSSKLKQFLRERPPPRVNSPKPGSSMQYSSGEDTQPEEAPKSFDAPKSLAGRKLHQMPDLQNSSSARRGKIFRSPKNLSQASKQENVFGTKVRRTNLDFSESESEVDVVDVQDSIPPFDPSDLQSSNFPMNLGDTFKRSDIKEGEDPSSGDVGAQARPGEDVPPPFEKEIPHPKSVPPYTCPPLYQHLLRDLPEDRQRIVDRAHFLVHTITLIGFVGVVYYTCSLCFNESLHLAAFDEEKSFYPICGRENVDPAICIEDVQLMAALDLANILVPKLQSDAVDALCNPDAYGRNVVVPSINEDEALAYLKVKLPSRKSPHLERDLKNFKILVLSNPHWEVQVVANGMTEIEKLLFYGEFSASLVPLPFLCYLNRLLFSVPTFFLFVAAVFVGGYVMTYVYRYNIRLNDYKKKNVFRMVNHILQTVYEQKKNVNSPDYISVASVRDLVFYSDFDFCNVHEWEEAVAFVNKNESRIRMEVRNVQGELVKVWVWLPSPDGSPLKE